MRTSAAGSSTGVPLRLRGFTLLELLVVVSIIALTSAGVSLAMRDSADTRVAREAQRLAVLLESARAHAQTSGIAVYWRVAPGGFRFEGLPAGLLPEVWLHADTEVAAPTRLELGPEPLIARQSVQLRSGAQGSAAAGVRWTVATDGLHPFVATVSDAAPGARP